MTTFFADLKQYVGFSETDSSMLRQLADAAEPHFVGFAEHFYACIAMHPHAHTVLEGPAQIQRLKHTLVDWMRSGLLGPHDEAFFERRCRIGRVHVHIGLPQQYMFAAMNVMRLDFRRLVESVYRDERERERATSDAVDKLFDLELAIMLHTYREDSEDRMRRNERLAAVGQIAASIGHDLRNPLSVIQSSLYILRKRVSEDDRAMRHIERIHEQIDLCNNIISNLLHLARNHPLRRSPVDIGDVFRSALSGLSLPASITVHIEIPAPIPLEADAGLLRQAIANLISNAIEAHGRNPGNIYLSATAGDESIIVEVADDGPGFDTDTIARVFEPLVTTRASGTGLGLALVKGVTERHGGTVQAYNRAQGGAAVRLSLPKSVS